MKTIFIFLFPFFTLGIYAQVFTGQMFDVKSKEPISYVTICIPGTGVGTVTDEYGKFRLNLSSELDKDTLQFSLIGYTSLIVPIHKLSTEFNIENARVFLEPKSFDLSEVIIKPKSLVRKELGNTIGNVQPKECLALFSVFDSALTMYKEKNLKKYQKSFPDKHIQFGVLFEIKKRDTFIEKLQVQICRQALDSVKLRLNIYSNLDLNGTAISKYENMLTEPIYLTLRKNESLVEIDLKSYNIRVSNDFILAFEVLKPEDYKKIILPFEMAIGGEPLVFSGGPVAAFVKMPLIKPGCLVTISYEKSEGWFGRLFD